MLDFSYTFVVHVGRKEMSQSTGVPQTPIVKLRYTIVQRER